MTTELGRKESHIENIDKGDLSLLVMPNMLKEHTLRYRLMVEILNGLNGNNSEKPTIIDMASARGLGTEILSTELSGAKIVGLEINRQYIKRAVEKRKKSEIGPNYVQADVLHAPLSNNCADAIAMFEIIEHIPQKNQPELLKEAFRLVKQNGLVMVSIPLPYSFDQSGQRIGASSNPFHQYEPSTKELVDLAKGVGFEIVKRYGQSFASNRGIDLAQKLEKSLEKFHIPAWSLFGINLNFIRNPKPTTIDNNVEFTTKTPLTQIFIFKKPSTKTHQLE
jgi:ubiquinone/menaquinone biosynthesis C-methylase UbiE